MTIATSWSFCCAGGTVPEFVQVMAQSPKTNQGAEASLLKQGATTIHQDSAAYEVSASSLTMEMEAVTHALRWIASRGDSQTTHAINKGPSSIRPTLELFQRKETPERQGGAHMGLPERIDTMHLDLILTERVQVNDDADTCAVICSKAHRKKDWPFGHNLVPNSRLCKTHSRLCKTRSRLCKTHRRLCTVDRQTTWPRLC